MGAAYTSTMVDPPRILVVEDDRQLSTMLRDLLASEGYDVVTAFDGQRALHEGLTQRFDVLLIDRGLPGLLGLDLLGKLRHSGVTTPAVVLSALANPADRVEGLDRGAEDYIGKPFDIDELLARLRSVRRRSITTVPVLPIPHGFLDVEGRTATVSGATSVILSERECALLETLARRPTQVFPRGSLLSSVFSAADDEGVVDTYVHYLRRKLGRDVIATIRGVGYRLGALE